MFLKHQEIQVQLEVLGKEVASHGKVMKRDQRVGGKMGMRALDEGCGERLQWDDHDLVQLLIDEKIDHENIGGSMRMM